MSALSRNESSQPAGFKLNALLTQAGLDPLAPALVPRFEDYISLLIRWNARVNLTAIRDEDGILSRHFVESILCARALPAGIATLLDFGSGAGFPGIPIALCRPEIAVALAESNGKKAAFLQEAARVLGISPKIYDQRAELLSAQFDCITLRAVDRMPFAVKSASLMVTPAGWLALMTTRAELPGLQAKAGALFSWPTVLSLPGSADRVLAFGLHTLKAHTLPDHQSATPFARQSRNPTVS
jgi:16S rRNA (guanine527-N7)-methyltransferase